MKILSGPYGTLDRSLSADSFEREFDDPGIQSRTTRIIDKYMAAGANVATTNTYAARNLIHGDPGRYGQFVGAQINLSRSRCNGHPLAVSFGPYGDAYDPSFSPQTPIARDFHGIQLAALRTAQRTLAWFETVPTIAEARGIAEAGAKTDADVVISFVHDLSGKILSGESLADAIAEIDSAVSRRPIGFSLNCGPIAGLEPALEALSAKLLERVIAVYPNASSLPLSELEGSEHHHGTTDSDFTAEYLVGLAKRFNLRIVGGCCGFTPRDIQALRKRI